ncbi:MAG: phosphoadenylyl-sulfate reductase [Nitrospirota bacterium]|nr:phosphoadenylyl-sulfate reductase [Nitrospirota bacterium]
MNNANRPAARPTDEQLKTLSDSFEAKQPWEVLEYALKTYPHQTVLACSFGAEDVALLDMMHRIDPNAPLFYLDTDFLFPETMEVRDRIIARYGLKPEQVIRMKSLLTPEQQAGQYGTALWANKPDQCCELRKIEPLSRILANYRAWITGIRRDQAPTRANAGLIEWDKKFNLIKINPLARWSTDEVWMYIRLHELPYNALHDRNYPSIGCTHCTAPILPGDDPRSGRWKNFGKTECGLHK